MACLRAIEVSSEESAKTSGTPRRTAQSRFVRRVPFSADVFMNRGTRLPTDVIPKIVDYWAHVGWYAVERDGRDDYAIE